MDEPSIEETKDEMLEFPSNNKDDTKVQNFSLIEQRVKQSKPSELLSFDEDEDRTRPIHRYAYDSFLVPSGQMPNQVDSNSFEKVEGGETEVTGLARDASDSI